MDDDDSHEYKYTVDEALASMGFGTFQYLVLAYAGLAVFAEAMEIMILSFVGAAVKAEWGLSSSQESLLTTVVFAGMLLGAPLWGLISDNCGRKKGFLGIALLTSGVGLLSALSPNYMLLVSLRCLVGFGTGSGAVFTAWFLEFVPAAKRGTWMVIFEIFWTLGSVFEAALAWIVLPRLNWRWLLALSSVPSFAVLLLYNLAAESPKYLCMKGRTDELHHILEKIALFNNSKLPNGILVSETLIIEPDADYEHFVPPSLPLLSSIVRDKWRSTFSSFFELFSSKLVRTTFLLWILFFGNSFSYYGIILLTSKLSMQSTCTGSTILVSKAVNDSSLYLDVFLASLGELPGLVLAAIIVDKAGRKISITIMFILVMIFLLPLAMHQSNIITTGLLVGARMCIFGGFVVACIFAPEIYPTSIRSTGYGVATAMGRIGGSICPLVAVALVNGCHQTAAIILFEVVIFFVTICVWFIPYETKGQALSDTIDGTSITKQDIFVK